MYLVQSARPLVTGKYSVFVIVDVCVRYILPKCCFCLSTQTQKTIGDDTNETQK